MHLKEVSNLCKIRKNVKALTYVRLYIVITVIYKINITMNCGIAKSFRVEHFVSKRYLHFLNFIYCTAIAELQNQKCSH